MDFSKKLDQSVYLVSSWSRFKFKTILFFQSTEMKKAISRIAYHSYYTIHMFYCPMRSTGFQGEIGKQESSIGEVLIGEVLKFKKLYWQSHSQSFSIEGGGGNYCTSIRCSIAISALCSWARWSGQCSPLCSEKCDFSHRELFVLL